MVWQIGLLDHPDPGLINKSSALPYERKQRKLLASTIAASDLCMHPLNFELYHEKVMGQLVGTALQGLVVCSQAKKFLVSQHFVENVPMIGCYAAAQMDQGVAAFGSHCPAGSHMG